MQNPFGGIAGGPVALYNLFKAWGVECSQSKVVADLTFASGAGPRLLPTLLSLNNEALNMDDVVTSQVGTLLMPFGGAFTGKPPRGLKQTVLAHTSKNSMLVDLIIATLSGEPSTRGFQPSGKESRWRSGSPANSRPRSPTASPPYVPPGEQKKAEAEKKPTATPEPHAQGIARPKTPWSWSPTSTC